MFQTKTVPAHYPCLASRTGHRAGAPALLVYLRRRWVVFTTCILLLSLHTTLFAASELAERSPFLPPGHGVKEEVKPIKPAVAPQGPINRELEFRGLIELGGTYQFSIFNKKEQKGYWLRENVAENGITVRGYDAVSSSVTINMNGRSERITMMTATENPLPVTKANVSSTTANKAANKVASPTPPQINNPAPSSNKTRRVVPRRRVILPNN